MDNGYDSSDFPTLNFRNPNPDAGPFMSNSSIPVSNNSNMIRTSLGRVFTSPPPPVPARPNQNNFNNGFNSFSSPFSGYGAYSSQLNNYGAFGGYGAYGGYGHAGYRSGFAPFGYGSGGYYNNYYPENRFIQMAEESSRPVLESVQSLLQAFSSVTMMFESSFQAIYSSYMSVVGVAANFCRIRSLLEQFFSGITSQDYLKESAWSDAFNNATNKNQQGDRVNKKQTWPFFVIMAIVLGGPYLLFKLMSKLNPNAMPGIWEPDKCPGTLALCIYDFRAASDQELSFKAHQKIMIAPDNYQPFDCPGWVLACNSQLNIGLVPSNYIGFFVQSDKSGETLIECNGQRFKYPGKNLRHSGSVPRTNNNNNSGSIPNPVDNKDGVKVVNDENKKEDQVSADSEKEKTVSDDEDTVNN